jgi:sortase A
MTTVKGPGGLPTAPPSEVAASPAPAPDPAPVAAPPPPAVAPAPDGRAQILRAAGLSLSLLGVFLLGFAAFLYGLSTVQEARSQSTMYSQLAGELSQTGMNVEGKLPPLGPTVLCHPDAPGKAGSEICPTAPGTPLAILNVPSIGMKDMVVVYGTSPEDLTLGPGLMRSSPLPGQGGTSEIFGRRATFGAPFARLGQLRKGALIKATTGQGISTYQVVATGSSTRQINDPEPNQLILLTAGSATVPTYYTYVDAVLVSSVKQEPGDLPSIYSDETALSGDSGALIDTLLWGLALAVVSVSATVGSARWKPWPTYLAAAPLVLIVLWNLYQSLAMLLPNVY